MMKKTVISAAILVASAGAAQAQMSIYGLVDMSYGKSLFADVFLREKADFHSGGDNGSSEGNSVTRIGIKGSSDLGSGIKGNFRFETGGIDSEGGVNGGGEFFRRQAWAGFSGGFGEVRLGRQDSVPFQTMNEFDLNGFSNGVSAGFYSFTAVWLPGRQSRSLQYISPNMGGVTAQAGLVPKGNRGPGAKDVISGGVKFSSGPLTAALAYQSKDSSATKDFASVAGSYDFGMAKVIVGYADGGKFASGGTGSGPTLGINFPIAGLNVGAQYAQNLDDDLKLKTAEVWVNKEIFKNTYAYFEAANWRTGLAANPLDIVFGTSGSKVKGTAYALGVIFVF